MAAVIESDFVQQGTRPGHVAPDLEKRDACFSKMLAKVLELLNERKSAARERTYL
jgi:hypothetical protein